VPADPGPWGVLGHHRLLKGVGGLSTDPARDMHQWPKVIGNARIISRLLACEDIFMSERINAAIGEVAMKFEGLYGQLLEPLNEALFFRNGENIGNVSEAVRQRVRREKVGRVGSR
jgi:hypothetical protein